MDFEFLKIIPIPTIVCNFLKDHHISHGLGNDLLRLVRIKLITVRTDGIHMSSKARSPPGKTQLTGQIEVDKDVIKTMISINENEIKLLPALYKP
jgi:hypothetical protein